MKTLHRFTVLIATAAFVAASVTLASAQNTTSKDLLTTKQVQELVATAKTPADHMTLTRHFKALAAKYDVEAKDHALVAAAYRQAPNASESKRPGAPDTALHCDRLGELARDSAKQARELATQHQHMADAK